MFKLLSTTLFAITLSACSGETIYVHDSGTGGTGGADVGGQGGETSVKSTQGRAEGGSSTATTTTATEAPKPELLCVPGASDECACPGGTKGAQVCAKDGMSYGECVCEPKVVVKTETVTNVETKTETVYVDKPVEVVKEVQPSGYSGSCVYLGKSSSTAVTVTEFTDGPWTEQTAGLCETFLMRDLFVNCASSPATGKRQCAPVPSVTGAYCCTMRNPE